MVKEIDARNWKTTGRLVKSCLGGEMPWAVLQLQGKAPVEHRLRREVRTRSLRSCFLTPRLMTPQPLKRTHCG